MGGVLTDVQYRILKKISQGDPHCCTGSAYEGKSKLDLLLGEELLGKIAGKVVIDFGCGEGAEAVELAERGARRVIGIDIREDVLSSARERSVAAGVQDRCVFTTSTAERADVVISIDAFEHFADPQAILGVMSRLLQPEGEALISFGPTWYHPLGGHLFSVFPWAHLLFSERALIHWRSDFKRDGATRFTEVAGGLNRMTIRKFEEVVNRSRFRVADLDLVPIRKLRFLHNRLTREFTTSVVRCRLQKRVAPPQSAVA
jgi:SAM-dependent methyltransferase